MLGIHAEGWAPSLQQKGRRTMPDRLGACPGSPVLLVAVRPWGTVRLPEGARSLKLFVIGLVSASGPVGACPALQAVAVSAAQPQISFGVVGANCSLSSVRQASTPLSRCSSSQGETQPQLHSTSFHSLEQMHP